jgi:hypothetical protein
MKYYETQFDEYCKAVDQYNYHHEIAAPTMNQVVDMPNQIFYGPTGCGKYSQVLRWIRPFSPSQLKYDRKMTAQTDKLSYTYRISDIHYEIDISMLGCNSKNMWEAVFNQIIDIVSVKADKSAIIVCTQFHTIHSEFLEIFYSYMRQYQRRNHVFNKNNLCIKYILVTEHLSFIPTSILRECQLQNIGRPSKQQLLHNKKANAAKWIHQIDTECIMNLKELESMQYIPPNGQIPCDIFNKICNAILQEMVHVESDFDFLAFRDMLYNITIYHLDVLECLSYILVNMVRMETISDAYVRDILVEIVDFLKYYNNNYRTIYHIERIFCCIIMYRLWTVKNRFYGWIKE